jgi:hypothetical protein
MLIVVVRACASNLNFFCNVDCHFWGMMSYASSLASLELQCSCISFPYNFVFWGCSFVFVFVFFYKKFVYGSMCASVLLSSWPSPM